MKNIVILLIICSFLGLLTLSFEAAAQNGYELPWFSIDGGASTSQGGAFSLSGTIGQADAGPLSGGGYSLHGGYWVASLESPISIRRIFLPFVVQIATN